MSNINNHRVNIKGNLTTIVAATLLAITGTTLPASATVSNTNGQHLIGRQPETLPLTTKGNKPSKVQSLNPGAKARARSEAIQSPGYIQRGEQIQRLTTQLNNMKPLDPGKIKIRNDIKRLQAERDRIVKQYEDTQQRLR